MNDLGNAIWIELRKAMRSRVPLFTMLGSILMPLGVAFLIFVARNPDISRQLGLVSAKANLTALYATDWKTYIGLFGEIIGAGGFFLFVFVVSWVFGREFSDGTLKDFLAVPVSRMTIILAKLVVVGIWSVTLTVIIYVLGLLTGVLLRLPQGSIEIILHGSTVLALSACLVFAVILPFAFFASIGRGYLLPLGMAVLVLIMANLVEVIGWGEYFPWAIPMLYSQGKDLLAPISYWIVALTGFAGVVITIEWWQRADQDR